MKKILNLSISVTLFFQVSCYSQNEQKKIIKEERSYTHEIKMGEIATEGTLESISYYNQKGKITEEINYSEDNKTTYKYNSDNKLLEKTEYRNGKIYHKKIYGYNAAGKKNLVRIYYSTDNFNSTDLRLWGAMRIYYNESNEISLKKWVGGITAFEEEISLAKNHYTGELNYSKTDSAYAIYHYGKNKKLDTIAICGAKCSCYDDKGRPYEAPTFVENGDPFGERNYPRNNSKGEFNTNPEFIIYKYDKDDNLIGIDALYDDIRVIFPKYDTPMGCKFSFLYNKNGKLIEERKIEQRGEYDGTFIKKYDNNGNVSEFTYDCPTIEKNNRRKTYEYNENGDEIEQTVYNYFNEPTKHWTTTYVYY